MCVFKMYQQVDRRVASSGVSQETLSLDHVRQIVSRLVFDSKIEEVALTPYLRSVSSDEGPFYRSTQQALTHYDRFTSLPVRNGLNVSNRCIYSLKKTNGQRK
jgi:hypothetical protein